MFKFIKLHGDVIVGMQSAARDIVAVDLYAVLTLGDEKAHKESNTLPVNYIVSDVMPSMGDIYKNGVFSAPPVLPITLITREAFRGRFTFTEKVAIKSSASPMVAVILSDLENKTSPLDVKGGNVDKAMSVLIGEVIIDQARKVELMEYGTQDEQF